MGALAVLVELCEAAEATSVLCTCETSGGVSDSGIVRCADCLVTQCRRCGAGRDLRSHEGGAPRVHACLALTLTLPLTLTLTLARCTRV